MASQVGGTKGRKRFLSVLGVALAGVVVVALLSSPAAAKMTLKDKVGENELKLQIYGFSQFVGCLLEFCFRSTGSKNLCP